MPVKIGNGRNLRPFGARSFPVQMRLGLDLGKVERYCSRIPELREVIDPRAARITESQ